MQPDAGKHLFHQLLCSDTGLPDTPPNKEHRPESSATDRPRTKPGRTVDKSAPEETSKCENKIYTSISPSPGFSAVGKMQQMTVGFRPQRATDGLARFQKVWSRKKKRKKKQIKECI